MYTSKQVQKENRSIVQNDEKWGGYGVKNGERLLFENDDTRGNVVINTCDDTPGRVVIKTRGIKSSDELKNSIDN